MSYRRLSHRFTVRCDDPAAARYVSRILGRFFDDEGHGGTSYELKDRGPSGPESRYILLEDGVWKLGSDDQSRVLDDLFARVNLNAIEATPDLVLVHAGAVVSPRGAGRAAAAIGIGKDDLGRRTGSGRVRLSLRRSGRARSDIGDAPPVPGAPFAEGEQSRRVSPRSSPTSGQRFLGRHLACGSGGDPAGSGRILLRRSGTSSRIVTSPAPIRGSNRSPQRRPASSSVGT